jgi:hypothetical protein
MTSKAAGGEDLLTEVEGRPPVWPHARAYTSRRPEVAGGYEFIQAHTDANAPGTEQMRPGIDALHGDVEMREKY